jgi:hypothetical protein
MKNLNKQRWFTKLIFSGFILPLFLMISGCSGLHNSTTFTARETIKLNSDILIGPGECVLKKFQGTSINNKFYLHWIFQSNTNQFFFQVESSVNGKKFKPCHFKQGSLSPGKVSLMLCMTDSVNKSDVVFYRIKAIPENYPIKKRMEQDYKALFEASTIMLAKNKKTKDYMQAQSFPDGDYETMSKEQSFYKTQVH